MRSARACGASVWTPYRSYARRAVPRHLPPEFDPKTELDRECPNGLGTVMQFVGESALLMGAYTLVGQQLLDQFTILGPYEWVSPAVMLSVGLGAGVGFCRGVVLASGDRLVKHRQVSELVYSIMRESGLDKVKFSEASEEQIRYTIEEIYRQVPWTYQSHYKAMFKQTILYLIFPSAEYVNVCVRREFAAGRISRANMGNMQRLATALLNAVIQSKVNQVEGFIHLAGWAVLVAISAISTFLSYSARKTKIWYESKKDDLVKTKEKIQSSLSKENVKHQNEKLKAWWKVRKPQDQSPSNNKDDPSN